MALLDVVGRYVGFGPFPSSSLTGGAHCRVAGFVRHRSRGREFPLAIINTDRTASHNSDRHAARRQRCGQAHQPLQLTTVAVPCDATENPARAHRSRLTTPVTLTLTTVVGTVPR